MSNQQQLKLVIDVLASTQLVEAAGSKASTGRVIAYLTDIARWYESYLRSYGIYTHKEFCLGAHGHSLFHAEEGLASFYYVLVEGKIVVFYLARFLRPPEINLDLVH